MSKKLISILSLCLALCFIFSLSSSAALAEDDVLPELPPEDVSDDTFLPDDDLQPEEPGEELQPVVDNTPSYPSPENTLSPEEIEEFYLSEYRFDPRSIDNKAVLLGWLMDNGYSLQSAAAIGGNLHSESYNINPLRLEGGVGNYRDYAGENFRAINRFGYKTYIGGFGISQWTSYGRVLNLQNFSDNHNLPVTSIEAQLRFLVVELERYNMTPEILNEMSFEEATFAIYRYYLTPGSSIWTYHFYNGRTRYFNDYSPSSYNGVAPLSETATPSAYRAFSIRFARAQMFMELTPERGRFEVYNLPYVWLNNTPVLITEPKYVVQMYIIPDIPDEDEEYVDFIDEFIAGESDVVPDDFDFDEYEQFDMRDGSDDELSGTSDDAAGHTAPVTNPEPKPTPEPVKTTVELPLLNLR